MHVSGRILPSAVYMQYKTDRLQPHRCFLSGGIEVALISKTWNTNPANVGDLPGSEVRARCAVNALKSQHELCYARQHHTTISCAKQGFRSQCTHPEYPQKPDPVLYFTGLLG